MLLSCESFRLWPQQLTQSPLSVMFTHHQWVKGPAFVYCRQPSTQDNAQDNALLQVQVLKRGRATSMKGCVGLFLLLRSVSQRGYSLFGKFWLANMSANEYFSLARMSANEYLSLARMFANEYLSLANMFATTVHQRGSGQIVILDQRGCSLMIIFVSEDVRYYTRLARM